MESKVRKERVWHTFVWDRWTNGNMAVMSSRRWCVWSLPWLAAALSPCSQAQVGALSRSCPCASCETSLFEISGPAKDWQEAGLTCQDLSNYIQAAMGAGGTFVVQRLWIKIRRNPSIWVRHLSRDLGDSVWIEQK